MKVGAAYGRKCACWLRALVMRVTASSFWRCNFAKDSGVNNRIGVGEVFIRLAETDGLADVAGLGAVLAVSTDFFVAGGGANFSFHSSEGAPSCNHSEYGSPFRNTFASRTAACFWSAVLASTSFWATGTGMMTVTFSGCSELTPITFCRT